MKLRAGGRNVGGSLAWGQARRLGAFPPSSPFHGLRIPEEVKVERQVLAQPQPGLSSHVLASLQDGTPLVTAANLGLGRVVLFHIAADASWSNLPLSGLFVDMLQRLTAFSRKPGGNPDGIEDGDWTAEQLIGAFGKVRDAASQAIVAGQILATGRPSPEMPPGIYVSQSRSLALNVLEPDRDLAHHSWPSDLPVRSLGDSGERLLMPWFLAASLLVLLADAVATLFATRRIAWLSGVSASAALAFACMLVTDPRWCASKFKGEHCCKPYCASICHYWRGKARCSFGGWLARAVCSAFSTDFGRACSAIGRGS